MGEEKRQSIKAADLLRHPRRSRRSQRALLRDGLLLLVMVLPAAGWLFKETGEDLRPFQAYPSAPIPGDSQPAVF